MRSDDPSVPDSAQDLARPSDLADGEADLADLFKPLSAAPPRDLGGRVLDAYRPPPAARFRVPRGRFFLVGILLLALAGGAVAWVSLAANDAEVDARSRRGLPGVVLDDPCVPLYRGLEDFRSLDLGRPDQDEVADR